MPLFDSYLLLSAVDVTEFGLGQQIAALAELLVKSGEDFIRTCTVPLSRGLNITCTLPVSGSGTSSDTSTQRHNEATLYLRKVINLAAI